MKWILFFGIWLFVSFVVGIVLGWIIRNWGYPDIEDIDP